jgi:hypothetical protein
MGLPGGGAAIVIWSAFVAVKPTASVTSGVTVQVPAVGGVPASEPPLDIEAHEQVLEDTLQA